MEYQPRGQGRGRGGRGRGRGRGGGNFQQESADGDMNMFDERQPFAPRGRGRGGYNNNQNQNQYQGQNNYRGGQNQFQGGQNHFNQQKRSMDEEGDQSMYDPNSSRGRGRGRGRGPRGNYQPPHQRDQRDQPSQQQHHPDRLETTNPAVQLMKDFLGRRYDQNNKLLNLSAIATDDAIRESGMFASESTQKKFFPALMVVCDDMLETREAKEEAIHSVTLQANNLPNLNAVYKLCWSLNHIKNLDLSNNAFAALESLKPWKMRFKNLEHLIVDPFPNLGWEDEITSWFPKLQLLNGVQVRNTTNTQNSNATNNGLNNNLSAAAGNIPPSNTPIGCTPTPTPMDAEQQQKEEMIAYVMRETKLKRDYAIQCLEAGNWNLEQAGILFQQSQGSLPPDAYN